VQRQHGRRVFDGESVRIPVNSPTLLVFNRLFEAYARLLPLKEALCLLLCVNYITKEEIKQNEKTVYSVCIRKIRKCIHNFGLKA
jgi:hypothetical protein